MRTVHGVGPAETEANILGLGTRAQRGGQETGGHSDEIRVLGLRGEGVGFNKNTIIVRERLLFIILILNLIIVYVGGNSGGLPTAQRYSKS